MQSLFALWDRLRRRRGWGEGLALGLSVPTLPPSPCWILRWEGGTGPKSVTVAEEYQNTRNSVAPHYSYIILLTSSYLHHHHHHCICIIISSSLSYHHHHHHCHHLFVTMLSSSSSLLEKSPLKLFQPATRPWPKGRITFQWNCTKINCNLPKMELPVLQVTWYILTTLGVTPHWMFSKNWEKYSFWTNLALGLLSILPNSKCKLYLHPTFHLPMHKVMQRRIWSQAKLLVARPRTTKYSCFGETVLDEKLTSQKKKFCKLQQWFLKSWSPYHKKYVESLEKNPEKSN